MAIGRFDLPALVFDLAKQPGVLDRQRRLRRESFQQLDHLGTKLAGGFSPHHQSANNAIFAQEGKGQARAETIAPQHFAHARRIAVLIRNIGNLNRLTAVRGTPDDAVTNFSTAAFGRFDPEGVAYDTGTGKLVVCVGAGMGTATGGGTGFFLISSSRYLMAASSCASVPLNVACGRLSTTMSGSTP